MRNKPWWVLLAALALTVAVYAPGLSGGWLLDDYSNIVRNQGVHAQSLSISELSQAALSLSSSQFKRPMAAVSFALNYLAGGLNPLGWKLVNLAIHLLNGLLLFLLTWRLLEAARRRFATTPASRRWRHARHAPRPDQGAQASQPAPGNRARGPANGTLAALIAGAWMLLPINLTAVLYVVQRMESLANLFVLLGLWGYVLARQRMRAGRSGLWLCIVSLVVPTALGLTAKETAVLLPLYAVLVEWLLFGFQTRRAGGGPGAQSAPRLRHHDWRLHTLFAVVLWLPLVAGLAWLLPGILSPGTWATRDFTLATRLLSEARIVVDYIGWTLLPLPQWLSFYHDGFVISQGLLQPWTTLASMLAIAALLALAWWQRQRRPLLALGIALFFACHLLTATILPLELVYEHRNYFASFGLMLAVVPLLARPGALALARGALLALLLLCWTGTTAFTAWQWGTPVRLTADLATRAPHSARAQYAFGRSLLLLADHKIQSPLAQRAYKALERAATLPQASILPLQALITTNVYNGQPAKSEWWQQLIDSLAKEAPDNQDLAALQAMAKCAIIGQCPYDKARMQAAFEAALAHPHPSHGLYAVYGDYAWKVLGNTRLGMAMVQRAVDIDPSWPSYHAALARMAIALGQRDIFEEQIKALKQLNYGGRLDDTIGQLEAQSL